MPTKKGNHGKETLSVISLFSGYSLFTVTDWHSLPCTKQNRNNLLIKSLLLRFLSERGDSNSRPLRPERSTLPTALLSDFAMQSYTIFSQKNSFLNFFLVKFAKEK